MRPKGLGRVSKQFESKMKISSIFCDIHPDCRLQPATVLNLSPLGDLDEMMASRCPRPDCHRNYARKFGYFDAPVGERPDFGHLDGKPLCLQRHFLVECDEYMFVTEVGGSLVWACPVGECKATQRYVRRVEGVGPARE